MAFNFAIQSMLLPVSGVGNTVVLSFQTAAERIVNVIPWKTSGTLSERCVRLASNGKCLSSCLCECPWRSSLNAVMSH